MSSAYVRWSIFILATILIVYFLPRKNGREFVYETNRPWAFSLLTAPFDIPVHLDSIRATQVRDSLELRFEPVYFRDNNIEKTALSQFSAQLNSSEEIALSPLERNRLLAQVRKVYESGIVDADTYSRIADLKTPRHKSHTRQCRTIGAYKQIPLGAQSVRIYRQCHERQAILPRYRSVRTRRHSCSKRNHRLG